MKIAKCAQFFKYINCRIIFFANTYAVEVTFFYEKYLQYSSFSEIIS